MSSNAQVFGIIKSNKETLAFANVTIKETNNGKASDLYGFYEIKGLGLGKYTLVVSMIGYKTQEKEFEIKYSTTISSRWLGFNMKDPILGKNINLRRAIAHAIDFNKYIEIMSKNTNLKANSIYNPSIPGYDPSFQKFYTYDLKKAKNYIKASGVNLDKFLLTYSTRGTQQINFKEAEFIKNQLSLIGIKMKIQVLSFSDFIKKGRAGKIQFFTDQWIYDYPDAENILQLLISKNSPGINKSGYQNKIVDELYQELSFTLDKDKRFKIMKDIERIVDREIPWIMLMYESSYVLHSKYLQNFRRFITRMEDRVNNLA